MSPPHTIVPLWINGKQCPASDGGTFEVRNPLDERIASTVSSASSEDCDAAVRAAGEAFKTWEHTPLEAKRTIFFKAAELITTDKYKEKIVSAMTEELATAPSMSVGNAFSSAYFLRQATYDAAKITGECWPSGSPGATVLLRQKPMGVIFAIAPWNSPVNLAMRAICIPLICGNTVVLKSSEHSPRCHELVAELLHEAGLPPGVLNFISVSKENTPMMVARIIGNPLIRKINFTGSDAVGKILATEAAKYLKPGVYELGGNSPAIVLNDANVEEAAKGIIFGGMIYSGQLCISTERVIVQREVAPKLIAALKVYASKLKAGDISSNSSTAHLGCLFTEASAKSVCSILAEAKKQGAEFLVGDGTRKGSIVQPHLLTRVRPGMRVWDRESFGPLLAIAEVDTVDEAVEMANAPNYSLMACLWTSNMDAALSVADRIRAGTMAVNGSTIQYEYRHGLAGLGGATGYGGFTVDDWTCKTLTIVHPSTSQNPMQAQFIKKISG